MNRKWVDLNGLVINICCDSDSGGRTPTFAAIAEDAESLLYNYGKV